MLGALGLGPAEEDVYRRLVAGGAAGPEKVAADLGQDPAVVRELLIELARRGLVVARDGPDPDPLYTDPLYTAAPPAIALGALLRQQRDSLREAELDLLALAEEHRHGTLAHAAGDLIEVLTDIGAVRHRFAQLQDAARHDVRSMMVPNLTVVPHRENRAGEAGLRRGVRYRAIIDRSALAEPGFAGEIIAGLAAGEEIRVADRVPVKLMIADSTVAMLPLLSGQNTAPDSILVRASGLLDALIAYFEGAWARAHPLVPDAAGVGLVESRPEAVDELDARILALLLAGLTDPVVAGQLGLSLRSLQRRLAGLMAKAGVETRMQLGWHAARRGWADLGAIPGPPTAG